METVVDAVIDPPVDGAAAVDLGGLSDHELLAGGLLDQLQANRCAARRLARMVEFCTRRETDYRARRAADPHFTLTPLQETVVEVGELWGLAAGRVSADLRNTHTLLEHFPGVWELCLAGQLEAYQAMLIAETARLGLDRAEEFAKLAERITAWLKRGIATGDGRVPLVNRTTKQLRNKLSYEMAKLKPKGTEEAFHQAFARRRVTVSDHETGMGCLSIGNSIDQVQVADYRLTLLAKHLRDAGDPRTLDQLRADLAIDLILGRLQADASIGELEHGTHPDHAHDQGGGDPGADLAATLRTLPTSNYARPIINVTVPIQTLMGLSDHPGTLSGGQVIPAGLARLIAADPDSTWYRMLTDPHGHLVELSTKSYRPTAPIWRHVVARDTTCYRRNCTQPATDCEIDHRVPWPHGPTATSNLAPGCRRDHKAKHAHGFRLTQDEDGSLALRTRVGFTHRTEPARHPMSMEWPDGDLFGIQHTATELLDAIQLLADREAAITNNVAAAWEVEKLWASYRESYPDATDEDIHYWIHGAPGEPEHEHTAPPITKPGQTAWERAAADNLAWATRLGISA